MRGEHGGQRHDSSLARYALTLTLSRREREMLRLLLDELNLEGDLDLVTHQHTTQLERCVPVEPEVLAAQLGGRPRTAAHATPRVLRGRRERVDVEHDR